ncbi:DUF423 domain-containing protein [Acetobacteraceae bacterium]|nr:DUF423 domain-containing protein [Acetobacteraceae bacterium]
MNEKYLPIIRFIFAFSGILIALAITLQAISAHLPDSYFLNINHRHYLKLAGNTLLIQSFGTILLSLVPLTPLCRKNEAKKWLLASLLVLFGTILFSSTLTLLAFGMISTTFFTPLGAILQMLGWIMPTFICISGVLRKNSHRYSD